MLQTYQGEAGGRLIDAPIQASGKPKNKYHKY